MQTTGSFQGLECEACETVWRPAEVTERCTDCGGLLADRYDLEAQDSPPFADRPNDQYRYAEFLPTPRSAAVSIAEGGTPLVECPTLTADLDVESVHVKDEGRNPTGSITDRGLSVAVSVASQRDATEVALPSTGNGAQSAAAYAGRAGLDSQSFVPSRCPFVNKAMINVHGGEMSVVGGRYSDALEAYQDAANNAADQFPVGPASPYRRDGAKTLYFEVLEALSWSAPDAIVLPAAHGIAVAGVGAAIEQARAAGLCAAEPEVYAVQPEGCAPIVDAWEADGELEPIAHPDTIAGPLEVPDPAVGELALGVISDTDGCAITVEDEAALEAAVDANGDEGVEVGATGGVALAGARSLAGADELGPGDSVVVVNPVAGSKESDLLRSYLMSQGV